MSPALRGQRRRHGAVAEPSDGGCVDGCRLPAGPSPASDAPRAAGPGAARLATSAIDLSDGLISDLGHILKASDCGARIDLDAMPYSDAMLRR